MTFDEMASALREAKHNMAVAENHATTMANILAGRLRSVAPYALAKLKRELRAFNPHTKCWRE